MTNIQKGRALILRTCNADMTSYEGFKWPESGHVEAPDWEATDDCRNGLHGFLWGEGNSALADWSPAARWIVAEVSEWIDLNGKVKFPSANVIFCGDRKSATDFLRANGATGAVIGAFATAGYRGTATAGNGGTATAGDRGTATAGREGTATAGNGGTATAGYRGTATAGDMGTATAGDYGTATAGDYGTATAGCLGTATAGYGGTATAGYYGTATAGDRGAICIKWRDGSRYRIAVGYIGEDGLKPNTPYRCEYGKFIEVRA